MNLHLWQGRYLGAALICAALVAFPGCEDDHNLYDLPVVDPGPEPEPDPGPAPVPQPNPNSTGYFNLYRTTDGGATWTTVNLPYWFVPSGLKCLDAQHGWLKSGESLYSTVDGGATWQVKLHLGSEYATFDAVSINLAWVAVRHADSGASEILRTTDGGATWSSSALPQSYSTGSLYFVDGSSGWYKTSPALYHTSDGGATWTYQKAPTPPGGPWVYHSVGTPAFVDSTTGWAAVFAGTDYVGGGSGFIVKYTTGNNPEGTWEYQLLEVNLSGRPSAVDADHAWARTSDGLFRTQDGGATWSNLGIPPDGGGDFQFHDASNGWMIFNQNQLRSTSDGGESWTVRLTLTSHPGWKFRSISFVSATTAWLVGP